MKKLFTLFTAMLVGAAMGFAADVEYTIQGNDQGAPKAGEVLRTQGTAVTMTANQDGSSNKGVVSGATFADGTVGTSLCSKSTQMRMSSAPDADNLAGTPNGAGCVSYTVVITKPVTNFKVYFEAAGTSRSVNLYNQSTGDKITIAGETNEVAMGGTNNGFVATEASVAPGTYTLYATGFGGGFMGVKYTVTEEGGEEPGGEEPGDFYGTLFHWQSDGNAISTGTTVSTKGGTLTIDGTANPSTESAAYAADVPDDMKSTGKNALKLGTNTLYAGLKLDKALKAGDIIYICGYNPYKVGTNVSGNAATTDIAASLETGSGKSDYQVAQVVVPASAEGATTLYLSRAKGSGTGFAAVKIERPEPVTEPVITAEGATIKSYVAGEAVTVAVPVTGANLVASTLTATLTPEVAGLSVALDNAAIVDGAIATTATLTYNATDNAKGQTTLVLAAGDFTKEVTVDYKALVNHAVLVPVAADANWDFSTGVSGGVDFGEPEKNIEFVYSEIEELTFTDEFKAESLAFQGTYPRRVGKDFAQDGVLHFVAAVPGTVEVKFSDTGSSASSSATPRYLVVNGEQTEFWASRPNNSSDGAYDEKKNVVGTVEVPAGDVYISGSQALVYHYVKFTAGEETPQPGVVAAPTFDPASGATVTPMQYIKISAEEGATIYWMDLAYEEYGFEEYTEDACMIPWSAKVGSTVTFQAYAEKDGVKSDVAEAVYTVGKTDPELAWYVNGETVTEFTYDMAKNTVDDLPKVESMSDGALTLTSSNEAVATINSDLGVEILAAGTTVITATLAETSMFAGATASFTLTVVGNEVEEETLTAILYNPTKVTQTSFKDSELGVGEGWTLECLGSKTIGQGIDVVVDGKTYRALKKSASDSQLRLTLPAEYVATGVTFYTYVNGTDLGTSYWSEVAGTEYTQEESPLFQATKENVDNLDVNSFTINPANSFTFDHKGKEVGLVMKVNYKIASGVESVTIFDTDDNAPVYNIYGQRVDDTYRGYVIKNGKKYLQK